MTKNMGTGDKTVRTIAGLLFIIGYLTNTVTGLLGIILLLLGIVFLLTSFVGLCPLYLPFKISTLKKNQKTEK